MGCVTLARNPGVLQVDVTGWFSLSHTQKWVVGGVKIVLIAAFNGLIIVQLPNLGKIGKKSKKKVVVDHWLMDCEI